MHGEIEEVADAGDGGLQAVAAAAPPPDPAAAANDTLINIGAGGQQPNGDTWRFQRMIVEENRFWRWLSYLLAILAIHSSVMIPLNCAFVVGDISSWILFCFEILFGLDVFRQLICVFIQLERPDLLFFIIEIVHHPRKILELSPFIPWSLFTKSKYVPWFKIARAFRVKDLLEKLENLRERYYTAVCLLKLIFVQLYCAHLTACIFYHQASDSHGRLEMMNSWLSNIQISDRNLTEMGIAQMYIVSLYYASVSLSTIGYGDMHPANIKEMVFLIFVPIYSLYVWTYLGLSIAHIFSRRSRAAIVTEKMNTLNEYLRRTQVSEELSREIRDYLLIKYSEDYENKVIEDIPAFMRIKMADALNVGIINQLTLFHGCSADFIRHLAVKFDQELYASGSTVAEENSIMKELKILYLGNLRQLHGGTILQDHVRPTHIFGLESFLLNEALQNTFKACELSRILSLRKRVFLEMLETYPQDATIVMNNVRMDREVGFLERLAGSEFGLRLEDDDRIKSSLLNNAIFSRNIAKVMSLVQSGISVNSVDYNKRSPLHVAASVGNIEITKFLIENGADVNKKDSSGATPLFEALRNEHDRVVEVLLRQVAYLGEEANGELLCKTIVNNNVALLRSLLKQKMNPNSRNKAGQTPLHIAASGGQYEAAKLLISYGADHELEDSWGRLPIEEAARGEHQAIFFMLSGLTVPVPN